jgi:transposase-like protein
MSKKIRKQYRPEFKAEIALAVLREKASTAERTSRYAIHPTMISISRPRLEEYQGCEQI